MKRGIFTLLRAVCFALPFVLCFPGMAASATSDAASAAEETKGKEDWPTHLREATEAEIRRTFEVNTLAGYWTTRAVLPAMRERDRGAIVTIASAAGLVGVARQTDYAASKWAAIGFTEALRAELRGTGVRTLVVAPYYIDTGMFAGVRTRFPLLLPILREADVARRILDAVERGRQQLILPPLARTVPALRVLPTRAFDAVVDFFGINHTMDHFVGRKP